MAFWTSVEHAGIWISAPGFFLALGLLVYAIVSVVRIVRRSRLLSVPLMAEQRFEFAEAGRVVLCVEGPRFSRRFRGLGYELEAVGGAACRSRRSWFRAVTSGVSTVRMELKYFTIPGPGPYILRITGLKAGEEPDSDDRIVFMRPHLARSIACVVGILLASMGLVGSIVLFSLSLLSEGGAP